MAEIKVNIPMNDYKPVINEKNVQYICDAFLNQGRGCAFNDTDNVEHVYHFVNGNAGNFILEKDY